MSQRWRLVNGEELYDIEKDPGQEKNLAKENPQQVKKMRAFYESWWAELEPTFAETTELHVGHKDHPVVSLTSHDWIQEAGTPWNQGHIRSKSPLRKGQEGKHLGHWALKVLKTGKYRIEVRRWPSESGKAINQELEPGGDVPGASKAFRAQVGQGIEARSATLRLNGKDLQTQAVRSETQSIVFETQLTKGGSTSCPPIFRFPRGTRMLLRDHLNPLIEKTTMKKQVLVSALALWGGSFLVAKPNVVVFLTDDQGWGDLSMNGNSNLETPHLDSLARDGASFDRFFVSPVCSPTRAEFLTGRHHVRSGVYSTSAGGERMDLDETTVADLFRSAGYATGAFGKWHNGMQYPYHPLGRGFDYFYGFLFRTLGALLRCPDGAEWGTGQGEGLLRG